MHLYVYYLKQTYPDDFIVSLLAHLLNFEKTEIGELGLPEQHKLKYEHRYLDDTEFNAELSIFCWENDFPQRSGGKVRLGSGISKQLQAEVLVQHTEGDPHTWVLIDQDRFFVAKEKVGENIGINLNRDHLQDLEP